MTKHPKTADTTCVIGAGIVGIQTAFQLAQTGERVLVVDAAPGPAMICSQANAGIVALGHAEAMASPAAIKKLAAALFGSHPALRITRLFDPELWRWGTHFLKHCSAAAYRRNSDSLLRAAEYSASIMNEIENNFPIAYQRSDLGTLYFFQHAQEYDRRLTALQDDAKGRQLFQVLNKDELLLRGPALAGLGSRLAGGLWSSRDISGDCYAYASSMAEQLSASGQVEFAYDSEVRSLIVEGGRVSGLQFSEQQLSIKNVVVTAGASTPALLAPLGLKPLIYPVKGYSATYPILNGDGVPQFSAIDETELVSFARYGDRFRITAIAEFAGHNDELNPQMTQKLDDYSRRLCGAAVDFDKASYRSCLRPSTPSSRPYIGRVSDFSNLWLNAGHGQLGWTLAAGCAKVIADLVTGQQPVLSDISETAPWLIPF